ncbi:MAG: lamin tail domain-containing protein [Pseudomonadota bacterium]
MGFRTAVRCLAPALVLTAVPATALAQEVPGAGDLVITEIVIAPITGSREWFEVENVTGDALELQGCILAEGHFNDEKVWTGHEDTVDDSLVIPAGARAVLAKNTDTGQPCAAFSDGKLTACSAEVAAFYGSLGFNNSDAETLSVTCDGTLVDEVPFDWAAFSGDCPEAYDANCSVNLDPASVDATANDDLAAWCVPWQADPSWDHAGQPSLNTAGQPNLCYAPEPACLPGEALFSELMIAPPDGYKEWVEVLGAATCSLDGCQILEGPSADPTYVPTEKDGWTWSVIALDAPAGGLTLQPAARALLARSSEWITGDGTGPGDIPADLSVSGMSLPNSEVSWLHLVCEGQTVDSAPLDWAAFSAMCPAGNCSVNLQADHERAAENDDLANWCLPPVDSLYINAAGELIQATPGQPGACLAMDWPGAGEVIFTEVMASPQGGVPEYLELDNLAARQVDLTFCSLEKHRLDEAGEIDPDSIKRYLIGNDGRTLQIAAGALQLLAYGDCLFDGDTGDGGDTAVGGEIQCAWDEFSYGTIQLTADEEEHLSLLCPDGAGGETTIDAITVAFSEQGVRDGHALMLDPAKADAEANDAPSAWCEAAFSQKIHQLSDDIEDCNFGSPGALSDCAEDVPEPLQPICRCGASGAPASGLAAFLMGLAAFGLRRRRGRA